jgi:hypothetical protein
MRKKCPDTIEKRQENLLRLTDSKNDLSSPAIGKIRKQIRNIMQLMEPIGLFVVA